MCLATAGAVNPDASDCFEMVALSKPKPLIPTSDKHTGTHLIAYTADHARNADASLDLQNARRLQRFERNWYLTR